MFDPPSAKYPMTENEEMQDHIERTRAQAASNYTPEQRKQAIDTISTLHGVFGDALTGCAFTAAHAEADDDPIAELSSELTYKRGRGRPRKNPE